MYQPLVSSQFSRLKAILTVVFAVVCLIFIIAGLAIEDWFEYCFWKFGLHHINKLSGYHGIESKDTYSDLHDNVCSPSSTKTSYQYFCPDLCSNLDDAKSAGILMIIMGTAAVIVEVAIILLIAYKAWRPEFRLKFSWVLTILPFVLYGLGFLIYLMILNPSEIDNPHKRGLPKSPKDYKAKTGMIVSVFVGLILLAQLLLGILHTRKLLNAE